MLIAFPVPVPESLGRETVKRMLAQQGYVRLVGESDTRIEVIQDRLRLSPANRGRAVEAIEIALSKGHGRVLIYPLDADRQPADPSRFSADLHCPDCDIGYREPVPNLFSFNSPVGACETCRGFGRTIGIDWGLVVPERRQVADRRGHQADPVGQLLGGAGGPDGLRPPPRRPRGRALA